MITVYRIEKEINGNTFGPFTASCYDSTLTNACNYYKEQLVSIGNEPKDDGCKDFDCSMLCGISNYMHFMTWFAPLWGVNALIEAGFQISVYHVPEEHVFEGETQIVFRPEYAKKVGSISIDQLLDTLEKSYMEVA